jgi:hypothetical protein
MKENEMGGEQGGLEKHIEFVRKPEGKIPLGRCGYRCENIIKTYHKKNSVRECGTDTTGSGLVSVVGSYECNESLGTIKEGIPCIAQ